MDEINQNILVLANSELIRCNAFFQIRQIAAKFELTDFEGWYWSIFLVPSYFEYSDLTYEYVLPYMTSLEILKNRSKWDEDKCKDFLNEIENLVAVSTAKIQTIKESTPIVYRFTSKDNTDILLSYNDKQVVINKQTYHKLLQSIKYTCFNSPTNDLLIWCLVFRHKYLGIYNRSSQLSVHPTFIKFLEDNFELKAELFASAFNHTTETYGSLFLDIECYFNSIGNFFDHELHEGVYEINPPFVTSVITKSVEVALERLKSKKPIEFILVLPVWDYKGQQMLKNSCKNYRYEPGEYEEMKCFDSMNKSEYLKEHFIVCDEVMKYYDYFNNRTISHVSPTHIYYLTNTYVSFHKKNLLKRFFTKFDMDKSSLKDSIICRSGICKTNCEKLI